MKSTAARLRRKAVVARDAVHGDCHGEDLRGQHDAPVLCRAAIMSVSSAEYAAMV